MPTAYDTFTHALDPVINPPGSLPVRSDIQPVAQIAWHTDMLIPPLSDRAFSMGSATSNDLPAPALGETGGVVLGALGAGGVGLGLDDKIGAWFWFHFWPDLFTPDPFPVLTLIPPGALAIVGGLTPPERIDMSAHPGTLGVFAVVTTRVAPAPALRFRSPTTDFAVVHGPFYKQPGLIVHVTGSVQQTQTAVSFRWLELPNPR